MNAKDPGAPCPPVEETDEDNALLDEVDADYEAEEVTE
ncbi:hypothetical protein SEA_SCAP1_3 [Streptomyces phage Scap1]|uniref:Uncharacterized protein n=1 Tax=Streptomyces phage Scap1 TaxID=2041354 RepID=A0A2D1GNS7_9CAUD|nr:hypothetical protein FDI71_gp03 [Streptomyces phage Scap1]ATN93706.1 hypothetical protein SEA_SCAP1_3 [Streptomyces phage Scap1]